MREPGDEPTAGAGDDDRGRRSQGSGSSAAILAATLGVLKNDSSMPATRA
jgi:hypothetical protein